MTNNNSIFPGGGQRKVFPRFDPSVGALVSWPPPMDTINLSALAGRVLLAIIFLASGFGKITNYDATTQYMAAYGMPMVGALCVLSILMEILGGLSLVLGFYARWGAVALLIFMVPTTVIFHMSPDQRIQVLKNLAIMGGLLQVAAFGPGEISLDSKSQI